MSSWQGLALGPVTAESCGEHEFLRRSEALVCRIGMFKAFTVPRVRLEIGVCPVLEEEPLAEPTLWVRWEDFPMLETNRVQTYRIGSTQEE